MTKIEKIYEDNKNFLLEIFLLLLSIALSFLVIRGSNAQVEGRFHYSYICLALYVFSVVIFFIVVKKRGKNIIDRPLLIILLALLLLYIFTVCCFDALPESVSSTSNFKLVLKTDVPSHIVSFEIFAICLIDLYLLFYCYTNYYCSRKMQYVFLYVFIAFALFAVAYSLIKEFDLYILFFKDNESAKQKIQSFTTNRNIYASYLLLGIVSSTIADIKKPRIYNHIISFVFIIALMFAQSATCFFVSSILFAFQFIFGGIRMILRKKKWTVIYGISILSVLVLLLAFVGLSFCITALKPFSDYISTFFKNIVDRDYDSFTGRTEIYAVYLACLLSSPRRFISGFGQNLSIATNGTITFASHNSYIQTWADGGLPYLLFFVFIIVLAVISLIRIWKKNKVSAATYAICLLGILIHGFFESMDRLQININGLFLIIVLLIPIFKQGKSKKHSAMF